MNKKISFNLFFKSFPYIQFYYSFFFHLIYFEGCNKATIKIIYNNEYRQI